MPQEERAPRGHCPDCEVLDPLERGAVSDDGVRMEDMVMEQMLGRHLRPSEHVHFRNGNGLDCRRVNLYLCPKARPSSQY
jgi:hypothetical protein